MRKEDRVAESQQQSRQGESDRTDKREPKSQEQMRGSAADRPTKPPRPGGKLPLPD